MSLADPHPAVGIELRRWRERRRRTQLDLALDAGVSPRHLSFVETGRSKPGAAVIMALAEHLEIPIRERNILLLAAGHAPAFPDHPLSDPLAPAQRIIDAVLAQHEPYPAMVVDRQWNLVASNAASAALAHLIDPSLLVPPINVMRAGLHPLGLSRWLVDRPRVHDHFASRLRAQAARTADPQLALLLEEIDSYAPASPDNRSPHADAMPSALDGGPIAVRLPDGREAHFFGLFATVDAPFDITSAELALELVYPADPASATLLESLARASAVDTRR
jgi:transcriptional regulator with XRE-family HTH domain